MDTLLKFDQLLNPLCNAADVRRLDQDERKRKPFGATILPLKHMPLQQRLGCAIRAVLGEPPTTALMYTQHIVSCMDHDSRLDVGLYSRLHSHT